MNHIFGPVNSRRFGLSLGIDLSFSKKQCNFDCVYCELVGKKAMESQDEISSVDDILKEIKTSLKSHKNIAVLTITANGEPTMYPYLKELVDGINSIQERPQTLILSNASLIQNKNIQNILSKIDIVKLSLDSIEQKVFKKIDRAYATINIEDIINGILDFKKMYSKKLVIEVLFVKDINDKKEHIEKLNDVLMQINPYAVDISTIDRPPAYDVKALSNEELFEIQNQFDISLNIRVAYKKQIQKTIDFDNQSILNLLKRRPQNQADVEMLFSDKSKELLHNLIDINQVLKKEINNSVFFVNAKY